MADIAAAVSHGTRPGRPGRAPPGTGGREAGLDGHAGAALFFAHLAAVSGEPAHAKMAGSRLAQALDAMTSAPMAASLYGGFPGVAWTAAHLGGCNDRDDRFEVVDDALTRFVIHAPSPCHHDLISGLVGIGVYALEGLCRPGAPVLLERVLARLAEQAEPVDEGVTWWTSPELLTVGTRRRFSQGYYDLGVAHGVAGVISLLGRACTAGVAAPEARALLDGAVSWLLAQKLPPGGQSAFSSFVGPGIDRFPSRAAWCYGDPGIAAALLVAARGVGRPDWEEEAVSLAMRSAGRDPEDAGVVDAGLCHGAVGLGHLFNRMYQATGEEVLAQAAQQWLKAALDLRRPGTGIGGFRAVDRWGGSLRLVDDAGLLGGSAGIGLALLAGATPIEPAWDRLLLVSPTAV